jgi:glycosyltransferase involved in cell wall biosynthesis
VFILIGRLLWDKGVREYVEAARACVRYPGRALPAARPARRRQPERDRPRGRRRVGREGVVEYLGEAHDVRPHIAAADCVVLPSYREGVPRTLMEASAMGRPIVATDVPGCRDVVADGDTGFLCRVRDGASLAEQMIRMIELGAPGREAMGARGRRKVAAEFDEQQVVERYRQTIHTLTGITL